MGKFKVGLHTEVVVGRCRVFGNEEEEEEGESWGLANLSALWLYGRACARSAACGRPRLASGLYRDYICKTIRLNHFLNKRVCLVSPLSCPAPLRSARAARRVESPAILRVR